MHIYWNTKKDSNISDFLDIMDSNLLLPHITSPTHVTATSRTIVENVFSNNVIWSPCPISERYLKQEK